MVPTELTLFFSFPNLNLPLLKQRLSFVDRLSSRKRGTRQEGWGGSQRPGLGTPPGRLAAWQVAPGSWPQGPRQQDGEMMTTSHGGLETLIEHCASWDLSLSRWPAAHPPSPAPGPLETELVEQRGGLVGAGRRVKLLRPGCPARNLELQLVCLQNRPAGQRPSSTTQLEGCRLPLSAAHSCRPQGLVQSLPVATEASAFAFYYTGWQS